jgi:ribonucleoside-diphosphate reductase alpha chain
MTRAVLPHRRPNETLDAEWQGHAFSVTVGYDPATGAPAEVFADMPKGGQMGATLSDACVLISIALQHGIPPDALAKSLAREPGFDGTERAASPIGVILEKAMEGRHD